MLLLWLSRRHTEECGALTHPPPRMGFGFRDSGGGHRTAGAAAGPSAGRGQSSLLPPVAPPSTHRLSSSTSEQVPHPPPPGSPPRQPKATARCRRAGDAAALRCKERRSRCSLPLVLSLSPCISPQARRYDVTRDGFRRRQQRRRRRRGMALVNIGPLPPTQPLSVASETGDR